MRYDKILQIIPNTTGVEAVVLLHGVEARLPIVCFALRYIIENKGTEDEYYDYDVVGMTFFRPAEIDDPDYTSRGKQHLIFVDEDQNERYRFLGYDQQ